MKKKKILLLSICFMLIFGISSIKVNAEDTEVMYVNSEEVKQEWESLENHLDIGEGSTIIDDGLYERGVPGEYEIKYKDRDGVEKQLKLVVVQSEGTIISIKPNGSSIFIVDDDSFFGDDADHKIDDLVLNKYKQTAVMTIEKNDGTKKEVITDIVQEYAGAGGGETDNGDEKFSTSYSSVWALPGYHPELNSPNQVKYYSPLDEYGERMAVGYSVVQNKNKTNHTVTSKNGDVVLETPVTPWSGEIMVDTKEYKLDKNILESLKSSKYKAITLSLTDKEGEIYHVDKKTKTSYKIDSQYDKKNIVVYQLKDEKLIQLESVVKGEYVVFDAPILPGQYIVSEKAKGETDIPPTPKKSTEEDSKKTGIVKTSDLSTVGGYVILMILSFGYIATLRIKTKK